MRDYASIPRVIQEDLHDSFDSVPSRSTTSTRRSSLLIDTRTIEGLEGSATITSEVASISKNLIGAGVLSLSGGIALYSNSPYAIISATIWAVLLGIMFGYFGLLIAKVCHKTQSTTYRECWEATMGSRGGMMVALISTLLPAQGDVSYATVLSQTFQSLLQTVHIHWSRVTCLLFLTVVAILPLCLMKDLEALSPFSAFGVASVGIAMICSLIRCFDGSYEPGGKYYDTIATKYQPSFGDETYTWSLRVLPYICMMYQAWVMHYNIPRFYMELKDATIPRFRRTLSYSFGLAATMYIVIAAAGYWTFGGNSASYILNNYSPQDPLATLSRVCIFISTLMIYPLAFIGTRDGCLDLLQVPIHVQTTRYMNTFSVILLTILTILAIIFHDLGLINAVGGGAFATFLCVVFPALMYRQAILQSTTKSADEEREVVFAMWLMGIGVILGLVGVWQSISDALEKDTST